MANEIAALPLPLDPAVHTQLAADAPTVAHYVARAAPYHSGEGDARTQAFAALDTYTLQNVVPRVRNGIELAHNMGTLLPTGSPRLDGVLGSGYRQGQMVELVGESGSGKSQVCLLAAAANAAAGTPVLYIDTGNAFSTQRTASLFQTLPPLKRGDVQLPDVLARIQVQKAFDAQALLNVLSALAGEPGAAISGDESPAPVPKLVIIDAFSAVVSPILGRMQQMQGHNLMIGAARLLKSLAARHGMAVIVVNHIVGGSGSARTAVLKSSTLLRPGRSAVLDLNDLPETGTGAAGPAAC